MSEKREEFSNECRRRNHDDAPLPAYQQQAQVRSGLPIKRHIQGDADNSVVTHGQFEGFGDQAPQHVDKSKLKMLKRKINQRKVKQKVEALALKFVKLFFFIYYLKLLWRKKKVK